MPVAVHLIMIPVAVALTGAAPDAQDVRRELACDQLEGATAARQAACPEHAEEDIAAGDQALRDFRRACGRRGNGGECRQNRERWKQLIEKGGRLSFGRLECDRARQLEAEVLDRVRTLAGTDVDLARLCPPCTAAPGRAVYRGRVVAAAGDSFGTWKDVEIEGADDDAAAICQAQLAEEVTTVRRLAVGLVGRIVRPCSPAPLSAVRAGRGWLLVNRRKVDGATVTALTWQSPCLVKRGQRTTGVLTSYNHFGQAAACEQTRLRLETDRREAAQAIAEDSRQRYRDELAALDQRTKDDCARAAEHAPWIARSERQGHLVRGACRGGSTIAACERSRRRALEAARQSIEAEQLQRSCEHNRGLAKLLRQRLEVPEPPASSDTLTCVAETP